MSDRVTVTTSKSWFSRVIGAIVGIPVGLLMFLGAFGLLWWNEGHAVHRARSLAEGAAIVVDVPADTVNAANEGKLVHLTGLATSESRVTDPDFGISAAAIRLERVAETYQWREKSSSSKRKRIGGSEETTTTYSYEKTWSGSHIDSAFFKNPSGHENPPSIAWEPRTTTADRVTCGAFTLSRPLVDKISGAAARPAEDGDAAKMRAQGFTTESGGTYYKGDPANPRIGDVRVRFEVVTPQTVSLVAVQQGSTFAPYQANAGSEILLLEQGAVPAAQMFKAEQTKNTIWMWAFRAGGFLLMFIGLTLVFRPLSVLGSVIPVLGTLLAAGAGVVAFFVALTLSLMTMALAWLAYRPLLTGGLLVLAFGSLWLLRRTHRRKSTAPAAAAGGVPPPVPPAVPPVVPPPIPRG